MKNVAVILNMTKENAVICGQNIVDLLLLNNASVLMYSDCKGYFQSVTFFDSYSDIFKKCDFAVVVGGDGTIICSAKYAAEYNKPLIGINMGRLGFAAELEPDEISQLTKILKGEYKIDKRMLIEVTVDKGFETEKYIAVNEAVISRGGFSRILDLSVYQQGEQVAAYRADGIMLSTPTGSTAYALSAGGPVIDPQMRCLLLTPICPHALYARSVVFGEDSVLTVLSDSTQESESVLTIDGQTSIKLMPNYKTSIRKADKELSLISLKEKNFYKLVNEKLKGREC